MRGPWRPARNTSKRPRWARTAGSRSSNRHSPGAFKTEQVSRTAERTHEETQNEDARPTAVTRILPYGVNKDKLRQAVRTAKVSVEVVGDISEADILLTTKNFYRRRTQALNEAESLGRPVYVLRKNTTAQMHQFLRALDRGPSRRLSQDAISEAVKEAEAAADRLDGGENRADLSPQVAYIRRLQHQFAEQRGLASTSSGREPSRRVVLYRR